MKKIKVLSTCAILCVTSLHAFPVISPSNLNGSFDDGTLSPWSGGSVVEDSGFAYDGDWFAETEALVDRSSLFIFFDAVPNEITEFTLSFYARTSSGGFSEVSASLSGRRTDNSFLYADVTESSGSALFASEWVEYTYRFSFQEAWDTDRQMGLSIDFGSGNPGALGFLDSVTLNQVPEPSHYAFILSCFVFAIVLKNRNRSSRERQSDLRV